MQNVITIAEQHALLIVFLNVLLSQGGLPLPVVPTLMTVAALARQSPYQIAQIILAGVSSALIAQSRCIGVVCTMGSVF
jgi:membrane protein DedA with SNARE-associated domain